MFRAILVILSFFAVNLSVALAQPQSVVVGQSPTGIEFHLASMPDTERVNFRILWPSNWVANGDGHPLAGVVASRLMVAGGTKQTAASEVLADFEDLVAQAQLSAAAQYTVGSLDVTLEHVDEAVALANEVLTEPSMDKRWFDRITNELKEQINAEAQTSAYDGWQSLRSHLFGQSRFNSFISNGYLEGVEAVTHQEMFEWHKQAFAAKPLVFVAGNISREKTGEVIDALLVGLPNGDFERIELPIANWTNSTVLVKSPKAEKTTISYLAPLPRLSPQDDFAELIAINVLGGGEQSRLFAEVRHKLRASYGFSGAMSAFSPENRILVFSGEVEGEKISEVRDAVRETYEAFLQEGVTDQEAEDLKNVFRNAIKNNLVHPHVVAYSLSESILNNEPLGRVVTLAEELSKLTAKDINETVARVYPSSNQLVELIVTDKDIEIDGACVLADWREPPACLLPETR